MFPSFRRRPDVSHRRRVRQRRPSCERVEDRWLLSAAAPTLQTAALVRVAADTSLAQVKFWANNAAVGPRITVSVWNSGGGLIQTRTTDNAGKVQIATPPTGRYRIGVDFSSGGRNYHGHFDFTSRFSRTLWVQEVVTRPSNVPVNGDNSITVTVKNNTGRRAIAGAQVRLLGPPGAVVESYLSHSGGQVAFWDLAEQRYGVEVFDPGTGRWVSAGFKDFATTGSRGWTPTVKLSIA